MKHVILASLAAIAGLSVAAHACEPITATIGLTAAACTPCGPEEIGASAAQQQPATAVSLGEVLTANVQIQNFAFNAPAVTIPLDAAVRWTNLDRFPHTSTSSATPPLWDSDVISENQSYVRTFNSLGGFDYVCIFHFGMEGTVTVRAPGDTTGDNAVNISDFATLAANFNQAGGYDQGNFNLDAVVNISDFAVLAANFNRTFPGDLPRGAAVPEPASLTALAAIGLIARRRGTLRR